MAAVAPQLKQRPIDSVRTAIMPVVNLHYTNVILCPKVNLKPPIVATLVVVTHCV